MNAPKFDAKGTEQVEFQDPEDGVTVQQKVAELRLNPMLRHAAGANTLAGKLVSFQDPPGARDAGVVMKQMADKIVDGDLRLITESLVAQAITLDTAMTELMARAWTNAGDYPDAFQRYLTLGLKAQAQSRTTLEALAKLHQPREQTVHHRHYHLGPDHQAVFVENYTGGAGNGVIAHQPHALGAALPGPNAVGETLPVASDPGKEAVPHARRERKRRALRQSKRGDARTAD